jgi:iron complex outermembrane receptor protein
MPDRRRRVHSVVRSILLGSVLATVAAPAVQAAELRRFQIPEGAAAQALNEFSRQAGIQVIFDAAAVRHLSTRAVSGEYEVRDALTRMLASTSLLFEFVNDRTIAVVLQGSQVSLQGGASGPRPGGADGSAYPVAMVAGEGGGALRLAQAEVDAAGKAKDDVDEVVVTSRVIFTQNDAFGATKMGLALKDTPQTVNVVTRDMIEFASIQSFNDFYKVDASGGPSHAIDNFPRNFYRGYLIEGNNAIRIDGFRMTADIDLDLATFDRFEVVKGPTSTLYGQNTIGGTLNAVSKVPLDAFGANFSVQTGSHDEYRFDGDLTGPLSGNWSYRLIAAYEDANSFLDVAKSNLALVAPSLSYRPNDSTTVTLRASYQRHEDRYHFGQATSLAGTPPDLDGSGDIDFIEILTSIYTDGLAMTELPRSRFFNVPWTTSTKEARLVQAQAEHEFAGGWKLRGNLQHSSVEVSTRGVSHFGPYDHLGFAYSVDAYAEDGDDQMYGGEINLFGAVEAFGREHTLFFGIDAARVDDRTRTGRSRLSSGYPDNLYNITDLGFLRDIAPRLQLDDYDGLYDDDRESVLYGGTVQLIVRPTDRLSVMLGARSSHDTLVDRNRGGASVAELESTPYDTARDFKFDEVTAQFGAVFELTPALNVYASFGETFEPSTRFAQNPDDPDGPGVAIAPEEGTSYEIGLKGDITKDLSFTVAVFDMERSNISQRNVLFPRFFVPLGTQASRGVELEVKGRLTPEWNLFLSAAHLDAEFADGEFEGLQPANAPEFGVSMFSTYEILHGSLRGLGFGVGAVYKSGRTMFDSFLTRTLTNALGELTPVEYDFGSFTEVDARVFYGWGQWKAHLSVTNLLDEKYYSPSRNFLDSGIHVNPPTAVRAGLSYSF